ncbi:MAG: LLM class flavin-dependent oxidoreductase [Balneolaceae bacterium]
MSTSTPYSVLDLAIVTEGSTLADAIHFSRQLAQHTESEGYTRFWMAEHHNMENIASSATSILLGYVAEATHSIRVGSGGIMLPNHSPLIIAEQFGTLATLWPNRVDLGLGRAPGTDQVTAAAIRPDRMRAIQQFPESVAQLQEYFDSPNGHRAVRAIPGEGTRVPIWILGSSTDSAWLAAKLGLPYAFASHFAPQQLEQAAEIYTTRFQPSEQQAKPWFMPCINVIAAEEDEQAIYLSSSLKQMFAGIVTDRRRPMPPPVDNVEETLSLQEQMAIERMLGCTFIGGPDRLESELSQFILKIPANELMIASYIFDPNLRLRSHSIAAEVIRSLPNSSTSS